MRSCQGSYVKYDFPFLSLSLLIQDGKLYHLDDQTCTLIDCLFCLKVPKRKVACKNRYNFFIGNGIVKDDVNTRELLALVLMPSKNDNKSKLCTEHAHINPLHT